MSGPGVHPHAELVRRFYDARARDDRATIRALVAPDVRWHDPYPPPHGGDLAGLETVLAQIVDAAGAITGGTTRLALHAVVADGALVVALVRWSATIAGRTSDGREAAVYRIEDGRIAEAWFHPEDPGAADAFFAAGPT
jgi:ketosteroid isomerase-like protein